MKNQINFDNAPKFSREESFKLALNTLYESNEDPAVSIVEIGCVRQKDDLGAGNSTELFAWYIENYGIDGKLISVDISQRNLDLCKKIVKKYENAEVDFVCMDGIKFLKEYVDDINLLYLDSLDSKPDDFEVAAKHHLELLKAFEKKLKSGNLILIDDIYDVETFAGKGAYVIPYLLKKDNKYECLYKGYQFLFVVK